MNLWRRARSALLRLLRVITWPVTWPLWKLCMAWVRRDPEVAEGYYDMATAWNSRHLGPYHRATLAAQVDHAISIAKLGELQQAEAELTEVIIRLDPSVENDARLLLEVRLWHHYVLVKLDWVSETEADARYVAEQYARQLGPDHPDTLWWRQLTAVALWDAGRCDEATAEMTDVAARRAAAHGASHPDTLHAERTLSAMTSGENVSFPLRPNE